MCQRPERASFISTEFKEKTGLPTEEMCQRPERASFISTESEQFEELVDEYCVNALNGLPSFLRYPPGARINTGFAGSFLQVFV